MSSMFIIILIIRIIKTTCFDNTILMAELEEKAITSPILVTTMIYLARTFRKVRSTSTLKSFYSLSYIFGMVAHLLMEK